MKASYIFVLVAALAVSVSAGNGHGETQVQKADGNNGVYSSSDGSLVGVPGAVQEGVNVASGKTNVAGVKQEQKQ